MDTEILKEFFKTLPVLAQDTLLYELTLIKDSSEFNLLKIGEEYLNNRIGSCPHCSSSKYTKDGHEKSGVQRYRCKECKRSFNSCTGTWLSKINKKELLIPYIKLMIDGLSLDKIKKKLNINKKTAFDWRHKIQSSVNKVEEQSFTGITESDETFFLYSEKGAKVKNRKARKRGGAASKRGISNEQVAVLVTIGRNKSIDVQLSDFGRISKENIEKAIGSKISEKTILCSDGHVSYKGFAADNNIEHHVLRANLKEYLKDEIYHIQHVNSADSRIKTWVNSIMHGVATKYLQNYMNFFRLREKFKGVSIIKKIVNTALDTTTELQYNNNEKRYLEFLLKSQKT